MGFTTSVENQTMFIVPMNNETMTIDYNIRFMITDNIIYPKTYEVTKIMDLFPLGCQKVIVKQNHWNQHTDLCGIDKEHLFFKDDDFHMVCDYKKSDLKLKKPLKTDSDIQSIIADDDKMISEKWFLSSANEFLHVYGQSQSVNAFSNKEETCKWYFYIDNQDTISKLDPDYEGNETDTFISNYLDYLNGVSDSYYLQDYFDISIKNNTFTIAAINKDMVNYIIKIGAGSLNDERYDDFVEMEVRI